jgi:hypothetical protein
MQNASVVGPSTAENTSILRRLTDPQVQREHGLDPSRFVSCYLSVADLRRADPESLFELLLREMMGRASRRPALTRLWSAPPAGDTAFSRITSLAERAEAMGVNLVWALDEFDAAGRNPSLDINFFSALRALAGRPRVALVTASRQSLSYMGEARRAAGSSLAGLFVTIRVDPPHVHDREPTAMHRGVADGVPVELYPGGPNNDSHRKSSGVPHRLQHVLPHLLGRGGGAGRDSGRTR